MKSTEIFLICVALSIQSCQAQTNEETASSKSNAMNKNEEKMNNPHYSRTDTTKLVLSDEEWRKILPDSLYQVARKAATEYAFTGKYWNFTGLGNYYCAACGNALFKSDAKFSSSCGWPSFYEALRPSSVIYKRDISHGMVRTEVLCGRCESHLGHIFDDGPAPTYKRFCMNSIILDFVPDQP